MCLCFPGSVTSSQGGHLVPLGYMQCHKFLHPLGFLKTLVTNELKACEDLNNIDAWIPPFSPSQFLVSLVAEGGLGIGSFKNSPGDCYLQPRLRTA